MAEKSRKRGFFGIGFLLLSVAVGAIIFLYVISSSSSVATTENQVRADATLTPKKTGKSAKSDQPTRETGPSGLPLPRFVSLKRSKVNVRRGPSSEHKIAWTFHLKGLPVEIVAEFEHWRRVRDSDGQEGWIYHTLLAGKRTVTVAPWRKGKQVEMLEQPGASDQVIAHVSAGALGNIQKCTGTWCEVRLGKFHGWISQAMLWGVYPNEKL